MLTRAVTSGDIRVWLSLAHEWDELISELIPDITVFYKGFDDYMKDKITQNEAIMAIDRMSAKCLGIVAFSKTNNRITFLGISKNADFQVIGPKLMEVALNQLDPKREISASVFKSELEPVKQERALYESYGFVEHDDNIMEAEVPACLLKKPPSEMKKGDSFHYDYPGYIEWTNKQECPFCSNEPFENVLIRELEHSWLRASIEAQGCLWGKGIIVCKKHFVELHDIPPQDLADFMMDVQKAGKALKEVSGALKINYELHGNTVPHLHIHLFPRYLDDLFPGKAIDFSQTTPSPYQNEAEFEYFIEQMRLRL